MNPNIDYGSLLIPNLAGFNVTFPYIKDHQRRNLYVLYPSANPMAYNFDQQPTNLQKVSPEEEIFPDFRCKTCSVAVPTYSEYKDHLASHLKNSDILNLNSPGDQSQQKLDHIRNKISILKPMIKNRNSQVLYCSRCCGTFKCRSDLEEHMKKHTDIKKALCVICKSVFSGVSSLRKHLLMFHCKNRDRKPCPYCSYKCFQTSDLEKHIARRHTRDFKYKCSHCVKGFATPKELRNHQRRKHPDVIKFCLEAYSS